MIKKFRVNELIFAAVLYSPLIALIMEILVPNSFSKYIIIMILVLFLLYLIEQIKAKKTFDAFVISIILMVISFINVIKYGIMNLLNADLYSFLFMIIVLLAFQNKTIMLDFRDYILSYKKRVLFFTCIFYFITAVYQLVKYSSLAYIKGPFAFSHVLAYYALCFYALMICLSDQKTVPYKGLIIFLKIFSVAIVLLSAVRSASLAMFVIIVFDYLKIRSLNRKTFLLLLTVGIVIYIVFFSDILYSIPLINKTLVAQDKGDISNGRSDFANNVLVYFNTFSFIDKFLGVGMIPIRKYMYSIYGTAIHAHNDLVNILCAFGFMGFGLFLYSIILYSSNTKKIWLLIILFFLLYFNGMYMYSGFCLMLPVIKAVFLKPDNQQAVRWRIKL